MAQWQMLIQVACTPVKKVNCTDLQSIYHGGRHTRLLLDLLSAHVGNENTVVAGAVGGVADSDDPFKVNLVAMQWRNQYLET